MLVLDIKSFKGIVHIIKVNIIYIIWSVRYLYDSRRLIISPNRIDEKSMNPRDVDC